MKKSYSLFEIILTVLLLSVLYTIFIPKFKIDKLEELTNRISLYISFVRFKALIENKEIIINSKTGYSRITN